MLVGRGRGHVSRDRAESLRRPVNTEVVAEKIADLDVDSVSALKEVQDVIAKYCVTVDKLKLMVNDLHERSLLNRVFGAKCVVALATQSKLTVDGTKLRSVLMLNIQTEFEEKEKLRQHNMTRFLNTLAFIGEVYRNVRIADNTPIAILAKAIIEYCKLLITGTEQEIELCVQQLALNGKLLQTSHDKDLKELQVLIRERCLTGGLDQKCLCWLHLACDLERMKYCSLPEHLQEFYKNKLGKESLGIISDLLNKPDPVMVTDAGLELLTLNGLEITSSSETPPPAVTTKSPTQVDSNRQRGSEQGSGDARSATRIPLLPTPQETKTNRNPSGKSSQFGSGRFGGKDHRNDPVNWLPSREPIPEKDKGIWGTGKTKGSSYGHDDRFDKEEGYYNSTKKPQSKGENWRASNGPAVPVAKDVPCEESWD